MDSITISVGKRIKHFRKAQNMTINQLSQLIHKSKSAISKYENGQVTIDIETLYDIAEALNINISNLVHYNPHNAKRFFTKSKLFGGATDLYVYYYKKTQKRLIKCYLQLVNHEDDETIVHFYLDVPSFNEVENCSYFYNGSFVSYDTFTYFFLANQANPIERVYFCCANPLTGKSYTFGLETGVTDRGTIPMAMKSLISKYPISDENFILEQLVVTKEDIKLLKDTNMFLLQY